jgi:cell division protease FtsH
MVMRWGMSDKVGNVDYEQAHEGYMGNGAGSFSISAHTKELIEEEVKRLIDEAYQRAKKILGERRDEWERLAQGLLEYEPLTGEEIARVIRGEPPDAGDDEGRAVEASTPSLTAIPKTRPKSSPDAGGLEPEPST